MFAVVVVAAAAVTMAGPLAQGQGKGKKDQPQLQYEPGEAIIRCVGPASASTDGLCSDGLGSYVDESLDGGHMGVRVGLRESDNNFFLQFYPGGGATRNATWLRA
jgi:hypothetical protein